ARSRAAADRDREDRERLASLVSSACGRTRRFREGAARGEGDGLGGRLPPRPTEPPPFGPHLRLPRGTRAVDDPARRPPPFHHHAPCGLGSSPPRCPSPRRWRDRPWRPP